MSVQPDCARSVPSASAKLSTVRQDVVPMQMTRPPLAFVSLTMRADQLTALVDGDPAPVDDNHITIYWRDVMTGEEGDTMFGSDDTTLFRAERELESA